MTLSMIELAEAEHAAIIKRAGGLNKLKKRRPVPTASTRTFRESGLSEQDIAILTEGMAREADYVSGGAGSARHRSEIPPRVAAALDVLAEQVSSGAATDAGMIPGYGWTETSVPNVFNHPRASGHKIMIDGEGWRHHLPNGQIAGRGVGAKSLSEYAKTIAYQDAPSEGLAEILGRLRGETPRPPLKAAAIMEAVRDREVGRTAPGSYDDSLRERLRLAVTR